jgi:hypothetical protein
MKKTIIVLSGDYYASCEIVKFEPLVAVTIYVRLYEKYEDYNKYICGYDYKQSFVKDFVFVMKSYDVRKELFDAIHTNKSNNGILKSDLTTAFNDANAADNTSAVDKAWDSIKVYEFTLVNYEHFVVKYEVTNFKIITDVAEYAYYTNWSIDHSNLYKFVVSQLKKITNPPFYSDLSLEYIRIIDDERQPTLFPYVKQINEFNTFIGYTDYPTFALTFDVCSQALKTSIENLNDSIKSFYKNTEIDTVTNYTEEVKPHAINMYKCICNRINKIAYAPLETTLTTFNGNYNAYLITCVPDKDELSTLCSGPFCNNTILACCEKECVALDKQYTDFTLVGELCDNIESYNDVMVELAKSIKDYYVIINAINIPIVAIPSGSSFIEEVEKFTDLASKLCALSVDFNANDEFCVSTQQILTVLMGDMYNTSASAITDDRLIEKTDLDGLFAYAKPAISTSKQNKIKDNFGAGQKLTYNEFIQLVLSIQ